MGLASDHGDVVPVLSVFFDSALGPIAMAYTAHAIVAVQLPEISVEATRRRLEQAVGPASEVDLGEVSPMVGAAVAKIQALLEGEAVDLGSIPVDVGSVSDFNQRVYDEVRRIGPGQTATYGEVAARIGEPGASQAVGRAMGDNPVPVIIPCHRVVGAGGKLVGFSAGGGVETKRRMLQAEGSPLAPPTLFDSL